MLNFEIDPAVLEPRVPPGTSLDTFNGAAFISIVGFRFLGLRAFGVPIPFDRDFDEVNLRFYVRRVEGGEVRRGVVFIREIVPRWAISAVARFAYNENYRRLPMGHRIEQRRVGGKPQVSTEYWWRLGRRTNRIRMEASGDPREITSGSAEEFITEHYWGYAIQRSGATMEYRVSHPRWRAWDVTSSQLEADVAALYGAEFARVLDRPPSSAYFVEGSPIMVYAGKILTR